MHVWMTEHRATFVFAAEMSKVFWNTIAMPSETHLFRKERSELCPRHQLKGCDLDHGQRCGSGNATQQVAKPEGELQVARKVLTAIVNFKKRTGRSNVTWSQIKDDVLRSKPPISASLPLVFVFVLRFSADLPTSCDIFVWPRTFPLEWWAVSCFHSCLLKPTRFLLKDIWMCRVHAFAAW